MAITLEQKKQILSLGRKLTLEEKKFVLSTVKAGPTDIQPTPSETVFPEFLQEDRSVAGRTDLPQAFKTGFGAVFPTLAQRQPTDFTDTRDLRLGPPREAGTVPTLTASDGKLTLGPPEEAGTLPTLTAVGKSTEQKGVDFGTDLLTDILSIPERFLGAFFEENKQKFLNEFRDEKNQVKIKSFSEEIQDPNSSLLKGTKKALAESDAPAALKILGTIGLGSVADPFSVLGLVSGLSKTGKAIVKAGARKITPSGTAIDLAEDITEQVGKIAPEGATIPKKVKGIETTPGEQQILGKTPDEDIIQLEALKRKQAPGAVERIQKSREGFLQNKLDEVVDRSGIRDLQLGAEELTGDVAKGFDFAFQKNAKEVKKIFNEVEKVGNIRQIDAGLLKNAKNNVEEIELGGVKIFSGGPKVRSVDELTQAEVSSLAKAGKFAEIKKGNFFDESGQLVTGASGKVEKLTSADLAKAGITKPVASKVDEFKDVLGGPISYSQLKNARNSIFQVESMLNRIGAGPNDFKVLKQLRKEYTEVMENHLRNVGGEDMVEQFRKVNNTFGDETKGSFKVLEKNFYAKDPITKKLKLKSNKEIFDSVTSGKDVAFKLDQLKKVIPEESYNQLRNAYFNNLMEKSVKGGSLDPKKFLSVMEKTKKDPALWDELLTPVMKDDLADMITDAVVIERLAKFKTPKAKEVALSSMLKGGGSGFMRWAIWHKFGAIPAGIFSLVNKGAQKAALNLETKQAVDFFKGVAPIQFKKALVAGGKTAAQQGIIAPTRKIIEETKQTQEFLSEQPEL